MDYFKRLPVRYGTVLLIAVVFSTLFLFQSYLRNKLLSMSADSEMEPFNWLREAPVPYLNYLFWALLAPMVYMLLQRWPLTERPVWPSLRMLLLFGLLVAAFHEVITSLVYYTFLYWRGEFRWEPAYQSWALKALPASILTRFLEFWALTGILSAVENYRRMSENRTQVAQLRSELHSAQLSALKKQLQPHFLFNTLNTVSALMDEDINAARSTLSRLGQLLRVTLDQQRSDKVKLEKEVDHTANYLGIETTRFRDRLQVDYDIPPNCMLALVPTMVLQPLVENSIKHGPGLVSERVTIHVRAQRRDGRLTLEVSDNGKGCHDVSLAMEHGGIGLRNTRDRLQLLYGNEASFHLSSPNGEGFRVLMTIPYETEPARNPG
jgi:two-component system, LytTR family, sensor kinase